MELQDLAGKFIELVFAVLAPIIAVFAVQILRKTLARFSLQLDNAQELNLRVIVRNLLIEVEEWAASRLKANISTTAQDKLDHYLALALNRVPGIDSNEAAQLAHQELGKLGLGAVASLDRIKQAMR